jgi:hypothetical protein
MAISPLAGQPAPPEMLVDLTRLAESFKDEKHLQDEAQRIVSAALVHNA